MKYTTTDTYINCGEIPTNEYTQNEEKRLFEYDNHIEKSRKKYDNEFQQSKRFLWKCDRLKKRNYGWSTTASKLGWRTNNLSRNMFQEFEDDESITAQWIKYI